MNGHGKQTPLADIFKVDVRPLFQCSSNTGPYAGFELPRNCLRRGRFVGEGPTLPLLVNYSRNRDVFNDRIGPILRLFDGVDFHRKIA